MPRHDALPQLPLSHGATVARGRSRAPFEQLGEVVGSDHPRLEARALERRREVLVDPGSSRAAFTSTRRSAPVSAGDPGRDRVGGHVPRRGQLVERKRRPAAARSYVRWRSREVRAALGARDQVAQQPAELLHAEDRHPVRGLRPQAEAAIGVAHGVGEARAAGHDEQRMAPAELAERGAQRRAARRRRCPPPTLTTVSTGVPPAAPRAPRPARPRRVDDRSPQARGDLACHERAGARGDDGSVGAAGARPPRSGAPARREERRDRVDLRRVELVDVGAHQPGDPLACELDRGRAAVGRRAVVGLRRWPSTRWTSALIAKSSDATGHQPPRTGTRGAIAARLVRSTPV